MAAVLHNNCLRIQASLQGLEDPQGSHTVFKVMQAQEGLLDRDTLPFELNLAWNMQEAHKSVATAKREARSVGRELNDAIATAESTLIKNLTRAERENATVYLQRIPNVADLPKVLPAPLVKPLAPSDLGTGSDGLFTNVIPDSR